ncbi:Polysaccharide pyruvyl transferase [Mycolicibacterium obuense]|uniref:Polysaccharide pyruvyl transferase n=1 Tax=Mycolicibacterium obuense TaxID=1807 RepID=A0A0J6WB85_9MYCO|nr:Polysaccharide pyruvyl transferase [Mycolicibacterium obuense]
MKRSVTFFSLKTQFENVGDALINRELIALCANRSAVMVDASRCPDAFIQSLAIQKYVPGAVRVSSPALFMRMMTGRVTGRQAYYFVAPGGYVGEKRGLAALSSIVNTFVLAILWITGVKICQVGVSYERLGWLHARILAVRSRIMFRVLVRDEHSLAYARALNLKVDGLIPDLAFGAARYRQDVSGCGTIALSFRTDQYPGQRQQLLTLARRLDETLPASISFRFIAQVERDAEFMQQLVDSNCAAGRIREFKSTFGDVDAAFDAYAGCSHVVSNRLHSLLFGLIGGCSPVAVVDESHNQKISGLFDLLGIEYFHLSDSNMPALPDFHQRQMLDDAEHRADIVLSQLHSLDNVFENIFNSKNEVKA